MRDKKTLFKYIKKTRSQSNKLLLKDVENFNIHSVDMGETIDSKTPHSARPSSCFCSDRSIFLCPTDKNKLFSFIAKLISSKSCGFDGINNELLQMFSPVVSRFFANLLNKSLCSGIFPNSLKITKITSLYKEGCMQNTSSNRPNSLLSSLSKVFEKIFYSRFSSFSAKKIISFFPFKYGFMRSK